MKINVAPGALLDLYFNTDHWMYPALLFMSVQHRCKRTFAPNAKRTETGRNVILSGRVAHQNMTTIKTASRMKHAWSFLLIALCFPLTIEAQITFQRTYGGTAMDEGVSMRQTPDSGYIIAGTTTSYGSGGRDVLVIKTDAIGDTSWTRTYGGPSDNEYGFCVQVTNDAGYIVSGVASSFHDVAGDMYLIRLTSVGDTLWTRTYGGIGYEWGAYVQQTSDGGFIIAGQTPAFGAGGFDAYLVKVNANGTLAWTKTYGSSGAEFGSAVQQTADGGYILSGQTDQGAGSGDFLLLKTDAAGTVQWTKAYGVPGAEDAVTVKQTTDGGYVIGGSSENILGPTGEDMCLIRTNAVGDTLWAKLYGGPVTDECYEVIQTPDGGFVLCGKSFSFSAAGDYDVYVVKTDAQGVVEWSKTYGGSTSSSHNEIGRSIDRTIDGGYVIAGESMYGFGVGLKNMYLIKTDATGNSGCNEGDPATITSNLLPQITTPTLSTSSGGTATLPATQVNSGTTQTDLCLSLGVQDVVVPGNALVAYPNPASDVVYIAGGVLSKGLTVLDPLGRILTVIPDRYRVDVSRWANGVYTLRSLDGRATRVTVQH